MRLIDADAFKTQVAAECIAENHDTRRASALIKLIDLQPTAYDVDKVVEQLENYLFGYYEAGDVIIDGIVKKGGVE